MFGRLIKLAGSPQGRRLLSQAQRAARDPKNRERVNQLRTRLDKKRQGGEGPGAPAERKPTGD
jgi:hypothetical protein